jgi:excisionase family DNA binding protein
MGIGITEAAERLGLSRQRVLQMIAENRLYAERVGHAWSISEADLVRRRVPVGRPLSPAMARGFLDLAAGERPQLPARDISRLRSKMVRLAQSVTEGGRPADLLRSWLPQRAKRREMSVAEADLPDFLNDKRFVLSGISDSRAGMSSAHVGEGYVDEQVAKDLLGDYFAVDTRNRPNLIVHVTSFVPAISPVLIAADLSDHCGAREDSQAREVIASWLEVGDFDESLLYGRRRL